MAKYSTSYPSVTAHSLTETSNMSEGLLIARADPANQGNIYKAKFDRFLYKSEKEKQEEQKIFKQINHEILRRMLKSKSNNNI